MSRLQWIMLPGCVLLLGAVIGYLGYLWLSPDGDVLYGTVNVYAEGDPTRPYTSGGCTPSYDGPGEFHDLKRGTTVRVSDESGKLLVVTDLSIGSDTLDTCSFAFAAGPLDRAAAYTVQVAERPPVSFTYEDLVARGWQVKIDFNEAAQAQ
jgi:hypothetical protein